MPSWIRKFSVVGGNALERKSNGEVTTRVLHGPFFEAANRRMGSLGPGKEDKSCYRELTRIDANECRRSWLGTVLGSDWRRECDLPRVPGSRSIRVNSRQFAVKSLDSANRRAGTGPVLASPAELD